MNTKEVLIAARKKIERPECWTRHTYARDQFRIGVDPTSDRATCWCALGAIAAVAYPSALSLRKPAGDALRAELNGYSLKVGRFNDDRHTTHADVLALFDRAIAAQGAE